MDLFPSFDQFEQKFAPGNRYATLSVEEITQLREAGLPTFYVDYLEQRGLQEFHNGFWWFVNPLDDWKDLRPITQSAQPLPVIRNAFAGFLVYVREDFYYADPQTKNFGLLGRELGVIVNFSFTDDCAIRNMHYGDFFEYAFDKFGKLSSEEMYAFVPAPALGGEFRNGNIQVVKMREQLHLLAQL